MFLPTLIAGLVLTIAPLGHTADVIGIICLCITGALVAISLVGLAVGSAFLRKL
jgi:small-conductance mechanosensitive channel